MELTHLVADAILSAAADAVVATERDGIIQVWSLGPRNGIIFGIRSDAPSMP
jgi:hypothetical protein